MADNQDDIYKYQPLWENWYIDMPIGKGSFGSVYKISREDMGHIYTSVDKTKSEFEKSSIESVQAATELPQEDLNKTASIFVTSPEPVSDDDSSSLIAKVDEFASSVSIAIATPFPSTMPARAVSGSGSSFGVIPELTRT